MSERVDLLELIGRYADGVATRDEARALELALRADPSLRREFLRYLNLDAALGGARRPVKAEPPRWLAHRAWIGWTLAAAAAVMLLLTLGQHLWRPRPAEPLATLVAAIDAAWADANSDVALRGGEAPPGLLRLEAGTAEFLLVDGATVVLHGPAAVRFGDRRKVFVQEGKIFCRCPSPASRVSVITPQTEVIDLGTEFAVEARADKSTRVAVLSGEVKIMTAEPRLLRKGEAVEVRSDGLLVLQPLPREAFSELLLTSPAVNEAVRRGRNLLRDPGFEGPLSTATWSGTEPNLELLPGLGRSGGAARLSSLGHRFWPQCRQQVATGNVSGRLVVASVWAASPAAAPLSGGQCAMLKLVFTNAAGREFAFAMHRFVPTSRFEQAQVAAFAPEGAQGVQVQLMLSARGVPTGVVLFDDASLVIADTSAVH